MRGTLWTVLPLVTMAHSIGAQCDPVELQKLVASDAAARDTFGDRLVSMSGKGGVIVVGAPLDDHGEVKNAGSAYVFVRSNGAWIEQAKLIASDARKQDHFGLSVAVSWAGDLIVVGAYLDRVDRTVDHCLIRSRLCQVRLLRGALRPRRFGAHR